MRQSADWNFASLCPAEHAPARPAAIKTKDGADRRRLLNANDRSDAF
jgi:hypothetical protein